MTPDKSIKDLLAQYSQIKIHKDVAKAIDALASIEPKFQFKYKDGVDEKQKRKIRRIFNKIKPNIIHRVNLLLLDILLKQEEGYEYNNKDHPIDTDIG